MTRARSDCRLWKFALIAGVVATIATIAPATAGASAPSVLRETASHIEQENARLAASIETGDRDTSYEIVLVDPCPEPLECIRDVIVAHGTLRGSNTPRHVAVELRQAEGEPNIEPATSYTYWISVRNADGSSEGAHQTFRTLPPGSPPMILNEYASKISETNATLHAEISPGALATEYQFWLADPCTGLPECIREVLLKHGVFPAGLTPRNAHVELASAEGGPIIEPGTTYEYWVVASNSAGSRDVHKVFTTR